MKSFRLIQPYFYAQRYAIIAGILCLMVVDTLQLFIPRIIKWAVDDLTAFEIDARRLLSYALYSIDSKVLAEGRKMASMPFVAYGILNYLRLADTENAGGSPVEIAFSSRSSQLCALGWIAAVFWSLN